MRFLIIGTLLGVTAAQLVSVKRFLFGSKIDNINKMTKGFTECMTTAGTYPSFDSNTRDGQRLEKIQNDLNTLSKCSGWTYVLCGSINHLKMAQNLIMLVWEKPQIVKEVAGSPFKCAFKLICFFRESLVPYIKCDDSDNLLEVRPELYGPPGSIAPPNFDSFPNSPYPPRVDPAISFGPNSDLNVSGEPELPNINPLGQPNSPYMVNTPSLQFSPNGDHVNPNSFVPLPLGNHPSGNSETSDPFASLQHQNTPGNSQMSESYAPLPLQNPTFENNDTFVSLPLLQTQNTPPGNSQMTNSYSPLLLQNPPLETSKTSNSFDSQPPQNPASGNIQTSHTFAPPPPLNSLFGNSDTPEIISPLLFQNPASESSEKTSWLNPLGLPSPSKLLNNLISPGKKVENPEMDASYLFGGPEFDFTNDFLLGNSDENGTAQGALTRLLGF